MTHSDTDPAASATLDSLLSQSAHGMRGSPERSASCCCGRSQCAYLEHNNAAMEGLEKDLQSAAQIGQALLARHDAYMVEAEEERRQLGASIDKLEDEKRELQATNAKTIEENRYLLGQLEDLNATVSKSDAQILSLNTTLQSTQKELDRLTVLAAQASHLEAQLASMEIEQADLQHQLISRKEEGRTAVQRWKGAERTVVTLQEAVDRIERESIEERERYAEVVTRFERRRAVERELESAAGRLKGAAVATTLGKENGSNSVVSHFVKDILQDNANLQLGIVELREMLTGSNEEVENLREQMMLHQPILRRPEKSDILTYPEELDPKGSEEPASELSLKSELAKTLSNEVTSDLHVHHHYHAAPRALVAKEKPSSFRRPKKRRNTTSPGSGLRTPTSGSQTPRTPRSHGMRSTLVSSADTILSQTSVTIPPSHSQRWSMQSSQASSLPSSPQSPFRSLSLFDTMDDAPDSSRPTTPGSTTLGSPEFRPTHCKRASDISVRNLSMPSTGPQTISSILQAAGEHNPHDQLGNIASPISDHSTILEEPEDESGIRPLTNDLTSDSNLDYTPMQQLRPRLHRASSHESMLSTRKIDIPSLRLKRTQLLNGQSFGPRTPLGTSTTSIKPVTSSTAAVAHSLRRDRGYDSRNYNRLLLGAASTSPTAPRIRKTAEKPTLGKRVGGWIFGQWGVAPAQTTLSEKRAKAVFSALDERAGDVKQGRSFRGKKEKDENRLSARVEAVSVDSTLLQESLGEG